MDKEKDDEAYILNIDTLLLHSWNCLIKIMEIQGFSMFKKYLSSFFAISAIVSKKTRLYLYFIRLTTSDGAMKEIF